MLAHSLGHYISHWPFVVAIPRTTENLFILTIDVFDFIRLDLKEFVSLLVPFKSIIRQIHVQQQQVLLNLLFVLIDLTIPSFSPPNQPLLLLSQILLVLARLIKVLYVASALLCQFWQFHILIQAILTNIQSLREIRLYYGAVSNTPLNCFTNWSNS